MEVVVVSHILSFISLSSQQAFSTKGDIQGTYTIYGDEIFKNDQDIAEPQIDGGFGVVIVNSKCVTLVNRYVKECTVSTMET